MQFLMLVCTDPEAEPYRAEDDTIGEWVQDVESRGVHVVGNRLRPAAEARTVRLRGGDLSVTDGPFAEVGEHIAGFDLLECASLEEAVEIAARHPMARFGRIEVRAAWPFEG